MKRVLILFFSLALLTGCSYIENSSAEKWNKQIQKLWEQEVKNDKLLKEFDVYEKGDSQIFPGYASSHKAQQLLDVFEESKKKGKEYLAAVKKMKDELKKLERKVDEINDDQLKTKAKETVEAFTKLVNTEIELAKTIQKMNDLNKTFYGALAQGETTPKDSYNLVHHLRAEMKEQFVNQLKELKETWADFHEEVTGEKLKLNAGDQSSE